MITLCGFGVSNYYNKLKLILLEMDIETEHGALSESQAIVEYLEDRHPGIPLYPVDLFLRAKCRELIQYLELNSEWVARRLYKASFFGGEVSEETRREANERLPIGLEAVLLLSSFAPYILGPGFSAADCVAYMHFFMIGQTTLKIYGTDMLDRFFPDLAAYVALMDARPHVRRVMADRASALAAFVALNVPYDG